MFYFTILLIMKKAKDGNKALQKRGLVHVCLRQDVALAGKTLKTHIQTERRKYRWTDIRNKKNERFLFCFIS